MRYTSAALAVSMILVAHALPATARETNAGSRVYTMHAVGGSGESGTLALKPRGARTDVEIHLLHAPRGVEQPAHIHPGTCASRGRTPAYQLDAVLDGTSDGTVAASLATLTVRPMAVDVDAAGRGEADVACADIGP